MKKLIYASLILLTFTQCGKKDDAITENDDSLLVAMPTYIVAGDTSRGSNIVIEYYCTADVGDTILPLPWQSTYNSSFSTSPINIDQDADLEIRCGAINYLCEEFLICRGFFVSNNYGNEDCIEFAILAKDMFGCENKKILSTVLFDYGDTISESQLWVQSSNSESDSIFYYLSYYYDHTNFSKIANAEEDDSVFNSSNDLFINKTAIGKYIGIRQKIGDKYKYGWIQCDFENYNNFHLSSCSFATK